jgi:hypothetical protein
VISGAARSPPSRERAAERYLRFQESLPARDAFSLGRVLVVPSLEATAAARYRSSQPPRAAFRRSSGRKGAVSSSQDGSYYQPAETLTHPRHRLGLSKTPISHWTTMRFLQWMSRWGRT